MARPRSRADEIISSKETYLGTKEAAAMLGVSISTIQKMVAAGTLDAWRTHGGHRRIAEAQIRALMRSGPDAGPPQQRKSLSVLVVEDNPTMTRLYMRVARQWGELVELSFASDAAAALLKIAQGKPDLVITDLAMEPFDGFHLIRTLRAAPELADTRVLVVTGLSEEEISAKGGLDSFSICYGKPLSLERFAGYIDARLQDRRHRR